MNTKNSGKSSGKFGQKQWEIRAKAMGNSGKAIENSVKCNGKFGKKQWEIRAKAISFARNICRRFPSFLIAFAQIFPLLLPEFLVAFPLSSGKSNEKTRKAVGYISGKNYESFGQFHELTYYFQFTSSILKDLASSARNSQYT